MGMQIDLDESFGRHRPLVMSVFANAISPVAPAEAIRIIEDYYI
jgi:hypothetical protein